MSLRCVELQVGETVRVVGAFCPLCIVERKLFGRGNAMQRPCKAFGRAGSCDGQECAETPLKNFGWGKAVIDTLYVEDAGSTT